MQFLSDYKDARSFMIGSRGTRHFEKKQDTSVISDALVVYWLALLPLEWKVEGSNPMPLLTEKVVHYPPAHLSLVRNRNLVM